MANTPNLNLTPPQSPDGPKNYVDQTEDYNNKVANQNKLDALVGHLSASSVTKFAMAGSGSALAALNGELSGVLGGAYSRDNRVIKEVVAWAIQSGSGGVSRVDVQVQGTPGAAAFTSIFSNNAFKPAISASLGNYGLAKASTFNSGSNMVWPAGSLLRVKLDTAAGADTTEGGQAGVTVEVFWAPSASL